MIQKIKLKNFQSLKDVTLSLGRVTVIKGASDVGKSAIIRGLNAFFNNSFNSEYAHNGNLPFGVALQKDNRVAFGRRTTKGVEYKFDSVVYSKTAKKIPQDISNFLGIYPYAIDVDMSVFFQIQKQFDQPFLLTESSITVAKIIGRISNLNIVLMAMREMFSTQLEYKQEINFLYGKKKEVKNDLLKFSNFKDYEHQFNSAEKLDAEIEALSSKMASLQDLISMGENYNARTRKFKEDSLAFDKLYVSFSVFEDTYNVYSELNETVSQSNELISRREKLNIPDFKVVSLIEDFIPLIEKRNSLQELVSELSDIENTSNSAELDKLSLLDSLDIDSIVELRNLVEIGTSFNKRLQDFKDAAIQVRSIEKEYEDLYNEFTKGKIICPFSKLEMQDYCKKNLAQ